MDIQCTFDMSQVVLLEKALSARLLLAQSTGGHTLEQQAATIMRTSLDQIPQDTGAAASTAHITPGRDANGDPIVSMGYDGTKASNPTTGQPVSDYLFPLHERLDVYHPRGKAKFLEDPIMDYIQPLTHALARDVGRVIGR